MVLRYASTHSRNVCVTRVSQNRFTYVLENLIFLLIFLKNEENKKKSNRNVGSFQSPLYIMETGKLGTDCVLKTASFETIKREPRVAEIYSRGTIFLGKQSLVRSHSKNQIFVQNISLYVTVLSGPYNTTSEYITKNIIFIQ